MTLNYLRAFFPCATHTKNSRSPPFQPELYLIVSQKSRVFQYSNTILMFTTIVHFDHSFTYLLSTYSYLPLSYVELGMSSFHLFSVSLICRVILRKIDKTLRDQFRNAYTQFPQFLPSLSNSNQIIFIFFTL